MKIRSLISFIILFSFWKTPIVNEHDSPEQKAVKKEAKHYCSCYKKLVKLEKKWERKEQKEIEQQIKTMKDISDVKLFGGRSFEFSFSDCMKPKRNKATQKYLDALKESEKTTFRKKVKRAIRKHCPDYRADYY